MHTGNLLIVFFSFYYFFLSLLENMNLSWKEKKKPQHICYHINYYGHSYFTSTVILGGRAWHRRGCIHSKVYVTGKMSEPPSAYSPRPWSVVWG